jgi:hypothetical protein
LLDIREERGVVDRTVEHRRRGEPLQSERGDDGMRLPVRTRRVIAQADAPWTSTIATEEIRRDARFVEEDECPGVVERLRVAPPSTRSRDVRPSLFVGVYRFF